jgi:hypothetical protein
VSGQESRCVCVCVCVCVRARAHTLAHDSERRAHCATPINPNGSKGNMVVIQAEEEGGGGGATTHVTTSKMSPDDVQLHGTQMSREPLDPLASYVERSISRS